MPIASPHPGVVLYPGDQPAARRLRISVPAVSARVSPESVASTLARMIASQEAVTSADLVRATGLARSTVTTGLGVLQKGRRYL